MATESAKANFPLEDIGGAKAQQTPGMRITDIRTKITLRGRADDNAFMTAAKSALGFALPDKTGKTTKGTNAAGMDITALCTAPDEWMLWAADDKRALLLSALGESFDGVFAAVVDVSDYYAVICLDGDNAADILASGCPLDMDGLQVGDCAQSHHGAAQILIHRTSAGYEIQTRISILPHLWQRFHTAL